MNYSNEKHEANQLVELASGDYVSRATFLLASRVISLSAQ